MGMKRVLLTGVAGFIGSHVAEALAAAGHCVVGLDNFDPYYAPELKRRNLEDLGEHLCAFHEGDVRDRAAIDRILRRYQIECIVHLAARPGVRASVQQPAEYFDINVAGTVALLEAARAAGVKRFVLASSSAVYGPGTPLPFREDRLAAPPASPYGATKLAAEAMCAAYGRSFGFEAVSLRIFSAYGPRQRPDMAVCRFMEALMNGRPVRIYGDGSASRDMTYVADVAQAFVRAVEVPQPPAVANVGTGRGVSVIELLRLLEKLTGRRAQVVHSERSPVELQATLADVELARKQLGWQATTPLEEGLRHFVQWWLASGAAPGQ